MSVKKQKPKHDPKRAGRGAKIAAARRELRSKAGVSNDDRLGYRKREFAAMVGVSMPTLDRRIRLGQIKVISIGGIKFITRDEAARLGLVQPAAV